MKITVTPKALKWFKEEVLVEPGMAVGFFGKVYGSTQVHEGFSIGMTVSEPEDPLVEEKIDDITFFVEKNDEWFFNGYDLKVDYNEEKDDLDYEFIPNDGRELPEKPDGVSSASIREPE